MQDIKQQRIDIHAGAVSHKRNGCDEPPTLPSCVLVIFGASGDLTSRKLFPALYNLFACGRMPEQFAIVGAARSDMGDDAFREKMLDAVTTHEAFDSDVWHKLVPRLYYQRVDYNDRDQFQELGRRLDALDEKHKGEGNRLFYLAVPPRMYEPIAAMLGQGNLAKGGKIAGGMGWSRIVVEKPFGHDLDSARSLDAALHEHFAEEQIFRIDHYLAKETVQNILMFRFANAIFEPIWNRNYIDYVSITAAESLGVGHRAGYYDSAGVLRDMFQNHMMQLLALSAMEPPSRFLPDLVRDEKVRVYRSLRPFNVENEFADLVLGQYSSGESGGEAVPGYPEEDRVAPDSVTPTFALLRAYIDNWRWQGVPFFITSGKRLKAKVSRIVVQFKDVPHSMLRGVVESATDANRLTLDIQPEEAIHMTFMAKQPAPTLCLRPVVMNYGFDAGAEDARSARLDAYEKVLLDCIVGDQMLFWRQDGVELTWGFLTPILEMCEECGDFDRHLHHYAAGTWGPQAACELHSQYLKDISQDT